MEIQFRGFLLACLFILASAALSVADSTPDLSVHLSMNCPLDLNICQVSPYQGQPGNPAAGHADFGAIDQPWSFAFQTGSPLSWQCDKHCNNYSALFGIGGMFTMNGPWGLTFTGQITSGTAWQNVDASFGARLSYYGQWSNGYYGYGDILDVFTDQNGPYVSLDSYVVPEPGSIVLLGTGALGLWRARRR